MTFDCIYYKTIPGVWVLSATLPRGSRGEEIYFSRGGGNLPKIVLKNFQKFQERYEIIAVSEICCGINTQKSFIFLKDKAE